MVRIFQVKELSERKKILLMQSDVQRQMLRLQVVTLQHSVDQVKRRFSIAGVATVGASLLMSIVGFVITRQKVNPEKKGFISRIFSGVKIFNQVKEIYNRMKSPPAEF